MSKLIKYEFRKTMFTKWIILGITGVAEILYLLGLYLDKNTLMGLSMALLTLLAFGGVLVIGLQSVVTLHRDMNTRQSYMLFMTPNSSYKILGAKVIENGLSILVAGGFFFALGALDITLLFAKQSSLKELWDTIAQIIHAFNQDVEINAQSLACLMAAMLTGWIATVTAAYLADAVSSALLNGKKGNFLVSFAFFIVLYVLMTYVEQKFATLVNGVNAGFLVQSVISLLFAAVMYFATAKIMEDKLSV